VLLYNVEFKNREEESVLLPLRYARGHVKWFWLSSSLLRKKRHQQNNR